MEILIAVLLAAGGVAIVLAPLVRRPGQASDQPGRSAAAPHRYDEAELDSEVERYRAALRAGTICERCRFPNPPGSRFCAECGRRLAGRQPTDDAA